MSPRITYGSFVSIVFGLILYAFLVKSMIGRSKTIARLNFWYRVLVRTERILDEQDVAGQIQSVVSNTAKTRVICNL